MPIREENKARYPDDWKHISQSIRDVAGNVCQACGVENGRLIYRGSHELRPAWRYADDSVFMPSRCSFDGSDIPGTTWDDFDKAKGEPVRVVLTVAHLDHQPENCDPSNLRAWCQRCHNAYDAPMRARGVADRRKAKLAVADMFGGAA